jgi:hypothetical protein
MRDSDAGVDALRFIRTVVGERSDETINLIKQGIDLRAVVNIVGGQRCRNDLASLGINPDVQFTPRPAPAVLSQIFLMDERSPRGEIILFCQ